jgi:hypothetical protein
LRIFGGLSEGSLSEFLRDMVRSIEPVASFTPLHVDYKRAKTNAQCIVQCQATGETIFSSLRLCLKDRNACAPDDQGRRLLQANSEDRAHAEMIVFRLNVDTAAAVKAAVEALEESELVDAVGNLELLGAAVEVMEFAYDASNEIERPDEEPAPTRDPSGPVATAPPAPIGNKPAPKSAAEASALCISRCRKAGNALFLSLALCYGPPYDACGGSAFTDPVSVPVKPKPVEPTEPVEQGPTTLEACLALCRKADFGLFASLGKCAADLKACV